MGNMHAAEYAAMGGTMALRAHLQSNHFPPIPAIMLPIAQETIERLVADEDATHVVTLPEGVEWKGQPTAPLFALHHFHVVAGLLGGRLTYDSGAVLTRGEARADLADHVEAVTLVLDSDAEEHLLNKLEFTPDYVAFDVNGVERWDYIEVIECFNEACVVSD